MTANDARRRLKSLASPELAKAALRFFKTGPGQYSEGDTFIGIRVPTLRSLAKEYRAMPLAEIEALLQSAIHEERHLALMILVFACKTNAKAACELYLRNTAFINNWDLVDCSAPYIVGAYLLDKPRTVLDKLVKSASLWERRIAIVATQHLIRHGEYDDTVRLAEKLLNDREDLMHKATGWMLREMGKKDEARLKAFLAEHGSRMPRTMLRYAIEKFPPEVRQQYLQR